MAEKAVKDVVEELLERVTKLENHTSEVKLLRKQFDYSSNGIKANNSVFQHIYYNEYFSQEQLVAVQPYLADADGHYLGSEDFVIEVYLTEKAEDFGEAVLKVININSYTTDPITYGVIFIYQED